METAGLADAKPRRVSVDMHSKLNWNFGNCGSVTYSCDTFPSDSIEREYCNKTFLAQKKISAFFEQGVVPALYENYFNGTEFTQGSLPPADQIPGGEGESIVFAADTHPIVQAIARADEVYASAYRAVTNAQNEDAGKAEIDRLMGEWADEVKGNWLLAGQWHWVLHKISHQSIGGMNMNPQWTVPNDKNLNYEELRAFQEYLKTFMEENEIIQFDHKGNPSGVRVETITEDDGPVDLLNKIAGPRLWSMTTALDSNGDPIGQLANYGHMMINTSAGIIVTSFLLKAGGDQAGAIPGISWFGGAFVESVISSLVMLVMFLIGPLMLAGGFLAYYLPAIPFIFWMFGVIGWMIMICESLVAAPIWAGAHALPEGEGMSGRYAVQGYQMLTNVLFRPILLLLGLVMSMQVLQFICFLAIEGFKVVNHSITGTGAQAFSFGVSQYFAIVFMNMVLVGLILSLSHKSYEMIFETADNVMRWVGFGSRPLGEAQGEQATSRVYGGAAIYSRDAAGAAAAKGNGQPGGGGNYAPIGGHEAHNARTGSGNDDYNGGGVSNSGNTPPSGGDGGGNNGGSPGNGNGGGGGQGQGSGNGQGTGTGQQSPTDRSIQGGDGAGNAGGGDKQIR
jgi:conjugal transfer/type IV secretion protein DotA/TraY